MADRQVQELKQDSGPGKWSVLFTVAFGTFMATLDGSIVNIALPSIRTELNAGDNVEWIVISYLLVTTSTLLIMGRLSDMYGRKKIYIAGFGVFVLGSVLCGLSWDIWSLVTFRVVQGIGAAMIFAIGPAIISDAFGPQERGRALGLMGTVVAAGSSAGPALGGFLLEHFGWPSIFFVNLPIGLIAIWRALKILPVSPSLGYQPFDFGGAGLFLVGITSLLLGIDLGAGLDYQWTDVLVLALILGGILLLILFLYWEKINSVPMLRLPLFRIRPFSLALISAGLSFTASGAHIFVLPFFLQLLLNFSPQNAGLIMLAGPLTLSIASPLGGFLSDKVSTRWIASVGLLISSTGYFMFSFLTDDWSWKEVVWRSALLSLGFGLFQSPNSSSALNAAPLRERGVASSLLAFMRNLGLITGIALGAAVWYSVRNSYSVTHGVEPVAMAAQIAGMQWVYRVVSGLTFLGACVSFVRGRNQSLKTTGNKYLYPQNS